MKGDNIMFMSCKCIFGQREQYYHREKGTSPQKDFIADAKKDMNPNNPEDVEVRNIKIIEKPNQNSHLI